ncbi:23S rRNA (guanosine(2251)-2'-O)-methyltransferase RlmB [Phenylobacterium sp.]|uniref:23S rRNA (guanosine(2251)-2'-O)-methyltransferase RlmB n=1 Tax=Phenylobacterium sp. TaxID=1871053 RepID=UPI0017AA04E6|nr:23S rRNA (guanosine(2251)-2'-O)-methyltransferase RlmB [Phenylobacterium sp.]MBA4795605.1 23S rRNA (guanosine(2251)-2'-O)-methyltransferase RlmB [Phenylobacterium sp.]
MSSIRERNAPRKPRRQGPPTAPQKRPEALPGGWIWGWHAVAAALENPRRGRPERLVATPDRTAELKARFGGALRIETVESARLNQLLPGAVHQGVALRPGELPEVALEEFEARPGAVLVMLDQVTDPQNVGAILRSAAAFGCVGVILQDRNAPQLTGALAKAAVGAVDKIPVARVVNLSRALDRLADLGWRALGLDGSADVALDQALDGSPTVVVMGSEGAGLRRLVAEHCEVLAKIPMPGGFESLNVSAAAAIALYEAARPRP